MFRFFRKKRKKREKIIEEKRSFTRGMLHRKEKLHTTNTLAAFNTLLYK
jgi:hypothetical protein